MEDLMHSLLASIVFSRTYSAVKEDGTKESREEVINRYEEYLKAERPSLADEISWAVEQIHLGRVLPSMRLLQFSGEAARKEQLRGYNCSFVNITTVKDFQDILYLSACGVGCGFSVQDRHISKLPVIQPGNFSLTFTVRDSREGWADSIGTLIYNPQVFFDYSLVRPAGAPLSTGGFASGPEPLRECHERIRGILHGAIGRKLLPIEVHSICTSIGHCIVAGGVRRSAMISLFDAWDEEMLAAKSGNWWEKNPHFARANNSAVLHRNFATKEQFGAVYDACIASQAGEPGVFWTNDWDYGTNPCAEISLRSRQLCNLTEVVVSNCKSAAQLEDAIVAATILGSVQASFTNFGYVHKDWSINCQQDALLGVSLTGQAENWEILQKDLEIFAADMREVNESVSAVLGISPSARIGTVKPSGTTSMVMDCSSGIHATHAPYYIRRVRIGKIDPLAQYLVSKLPEQFVEYSPYEPNDVIIAMPVKREGVTRLDETSLQLLERVKYIKQNWIDPSHVSGPNSHNVSVTVNYKSEEVQEIKEWMWNNRTEYNGISLLPVANTYDYAPYEDITEERYNELIAQFPVIDLADVVYRISDDGRNDTSGCDAGLCAIK
jgi:ribonucleoside-diphosphate reductase alpha chain